MREIIININNRIPSIFCYPGPPEHEKNELNKLPALLLLHGFGSQKNEVDNTYQKLAHALAKNGIASLRIDFSGWGDSQEKMELSNLDNMLKDAMISYEYLQSHELIKTEQIGICGFSLGAYIAFRLAQLIEKACIHPCAALIMLSPSGNPVEDFKHELGPDLDPLTKDEINTFNIGWRDVLLGKCFFKSLVSSQSISKLGPLNTKILAIAAQQDFSYQYLETIAQATSHTDSKSISIDNSNHIFGIFTALDQSSFVINSIEQWIINIWKLTTKHNTQSAEISMMQNYSGNGVFSPPVSELLAASQVEERNRDLNNNFNSK